MISDKKAAAPFRAIFGKGLRFFFATELLKEVFFATEPLKEVFFATEPLKEVFFVTERPEEVFRSRYTEVFVSSK